jgi:hypothetical protein
MTTSVQRAGLPFLWRFVKSLPEEPSSHVRYDAARQIAQVFQNGEWIDSPDAANETMGGTRKTAVAQETTDDE